MIKVIVNGSLGKMGKVLTRCIEEDPNLELVCGVSLIKTEDTSYKFYTSMNEITESADVIIDFSHYSALDDVLNYALKSKTPLVIATTGYSEYDLQRIKYASSVIPIFHSSNMSLGVNVLIKLVKEASRALDGFDIEIIEKHHNKKVDSPSGTALMLANSIKEVLPNVEYSYGRYGRSTQRANSEVGIHAVRGGTVVGDHDVIFAGGDEIVELSHKAQSKDIFAKGAITAAKFLIDQIPAYYNMNDMI